MEPYPIDFDSLQKGDVIPVEKLREIYGPCSESELDFKRLELVLEIEMRRRDLYPVSKDGGIAILTDREAAEHSVKRHEHLVRGMQRNARRRSRIDASDFSDPEKRTVEFWDNQIVAQAIAVQKQLRAAKRELLLAAPKKEDVPT